MRCCRTRKRRWVRYETTNPTRQRGVQWRTSLTRKLHEQSQMSYPSGLKQMQISSSPSPREFAHLLSALESSAERIHEERGLGGEELFACSRLSGITILAKDDVYRARLKSYFPSPPSPLSLKFGESLIKWRRAEVRIFGRGGARVLGFDSIEDTFPITRRVSSPSSTNYRT